MLREVGGGEGGRARLEVTVDGRLVVATEPELQIFLLSDVLEQKSEEPLKLKVRDKDAGSELPYFSYLIIVGRGRVYRDNTSTPREMCSLDSASIAGVRLARRSAWWPWLCSWCHDAKCKMMRSSCAADARYFLWPFRLPC